MSELSKTTCFFAAALAAIALALLTKPSTEEYNVEELRGKLLVDNFPFEAPKRLEVSSMNEETGDLNTFEVAEINGVWSIPSKSGYPADATEQMAAAVEGVVGREILDVIDAKSGDHAMYGVVDPADTTVDEGFGTHVQLIDGDDKTLADVIVGNEVKDQPGQYYVRKAKQDVIYTAELDVDKFSTDFSNWIEKDLLGFSAFDVAQVYIDDYAIEMNLVLTNRGLQPDIQWDRGARMRLVYDDEESKWKADSLESFNVEQDAYETFTLAEDQELNADALRALKEAMDDLEIVDVERKPEGLSADLQTGQDFMDDEETLQSLAKRGFLPLPKDLSNPRGGLELQSSEGEVVVTLKDGVEYVLRFGDLQVDPSKQGAEAPADEAAEEAQVGDEGLNRYLFVMARLNEAVIQKPVLETLPEFPSEEETPEETTEEPATDEPATDEATEDDAAEGDSDEGDSDEGDSSTTEEATDDEAAGEEAAEDEAGAEEAEAEEPKPTREEIEAERARIEQNNKRAEEEYKENVEKAKERVAELNARFGDWYYVIPNDVFKKIHLDRDQIIKAAELAEGEGEAKDPNLSDFGAPGAAIPGLPNLGSPSAEAEE
ncbi:DUF4340 domain-containing protein [Rubripirellula amarantea]|nr:DUF4340 domain-containing protein [Rubripirellula amarantea]